MSSQWKLRSVRSILQAERWIIAGAAGAVFGNIGLGTGQVTTEALISVYVPLLVVLSAMDYLFQLWEDFVEKGVRSKGLR